MKLQLSLLTIFVLTFFVNCSPEKRLSRILKKHPELKVQDTITFKDTTVVKGSTVDSTFIFSKDTVVISDSNQVIKYYYNNATHQHYIKGEVKDRVVVKEIKVPYTKYVIPEKSWWDKYKDIIYIVLIAALVLKSFWK